MRIQDRLINRGRLRRRWRWRVGRGAKPVRAVILVVALLALLVSTVGTLLLPVPGSQALRSENHKGVVRSAFPFLRTTVRSHIAGQNVHVDFLPVFLPFNHFTACDFLGASREVAWRESQAVKYLGPHTLDAWRAAGELGFALHIVEDFYAHSNWVELGQRDLLAPGTGNFVELEPETLVRDDVMILQDDGVHRLSDGSRVLSGGLTPRVQGPDGKVYAGLVTGSGKHLFYNAVGQIRDTMCPKGTAISHSVLNKDDAADRWYRVARALAVRQTRQEWCRLLNQVRDAHGWNALNTPLGLWMRPGTISLPPGNRCGGPSRGTGIFKPGMATQRVTVSVRAVRVRDDRTTPGPGRLNLVLGLYDGTFQRSVRTTSRPLLQGPGRVRGASLPATASLCVDPEQPLVTFLTGWADARARGASVGTYDDGSTDARQTVRRRKDRVLQGPTYSAPTPERATGVHRLRNGEDLTGTVKVSRVKEDPDHDGASSCMEEAAGTSPQLPDTDRDGLSDGVELLVTKTDALLPDKDHGVVPGPPVTTSAGASSPSSAVGPRTVRSSRGDNSSQRLAIAGGIAVAAGLLLYGIATLRGRTPTAKNTR